MRSQLRPTQRHALAATLLGFICVLLGLVGFQLNLGALDSRSFGAKAGVTFVVTPAEPRGFARASGAHVSSSAAWQLRQASVDGRRVVAARRGQVREAASMAETDQQEEDTVPRPYGQPETATVVSVEFERDRWEVRMKLNKDRRLGTMLIDDQNSRLQDIVRYIKTGDVLEDVYIRVRLSERKFEPYMPTLEAFLKDRIVTFDDFVEGYDGGPLSGELISWMWDDRGAYCTYFVDVGCHERAILDLSSPGAKVLARKLQRGDVIEVLTVQIDRRNEMLIAQPDLDKLADLVEENEERSEEIEPQWKRPFRKRSLSWGLAER